jgi:hypothetical protein
MRININHPSFINSFNNINTMVMAHAPVGDYFNLPSDKKMGVLYSVFTVLKSGVNLRIKLSDEELKNFVDIMWKKNEEMENYEFAAALKDISTNYKSICESTKPKRKNSKIVKLDKPSDG